MYCVCFHCNIEIFECLKNVKVKQKTKCIINVDIDTPLEMKNQGIMWGVGDLFQTENSSI